MNNKKIAIIIILATLLAFLVSMLFFKTDKKVTEPQENTVEINEPVENIEVKQENKEAIKVKTPENKIQQAPKIEMPKIEPIKIEPIINEIELTEPYKAEENVIVIPQEYKIKSPAKYSFK